MNLPANHAVGQTGHTTDHNTIETTLNTHATQIAGKVDTTTANATYVPSGTRAAQDAMRATRDRAYAVWDAAVATEARTPVLYIYGHSYVAGSGASDQAHAFPAQLAARVQAERVSATVVSEGHAGYTSAQLVTQLPSSTFHSQTAGSVACLVVMALANDWYNNVNPATSQTNLQTLIANARADAAAGPNMTVVIAVEPQRSDTFTSSYTWSQYVAAAQAVADADPYTVCVDLGGRMGTTMPDPMALFQTDHVHPTDAGHALIAGILAAELMRNRWPAAPPPSHIPLLAACAPVANVGWSGVTRDTDGAILRYSDAAQNDTITYNFVGDAGTYTISLDHRQQANAGKYDLYIDGVLQGAGGTWDGYAASNADAFSEVAGFAVTASGRHSLQLKMASKNASSSGYAGVIRGIYVTRTGS